MRCFRLVYYYNVKSIQKENIPDFMRLGIILDGLNVRVPTLLYETRV